MQLATHFACGKPCIGFEPKRAFNILVIQSEDSDNDIAIMRDGALSLLSDQEKEMVYKNIVFVRLRGSAGKEFLSALDNYCNEHDPDIVFVNPLLKYYGGDPMNPREVTEFLNELEPLLEKHNCGLVLVHHTTKPNPQSKPIPFDSSNAGFGSVVWSNSVRDTIAIRKAKVPGYYELATGKRSSKWGWNNRFIQRSAMVTLPYWRDVDANTVKELVAADKTKSKDTTKKNREALLEAIKPLPETITVPEIMDLTDMPERTVRRYIKMLEDSKEICSETRGNGIKGYYRSFSKN
jgi:hypothetical protein